MTNEHQSANQLNQTFVAVTSESFRLPASRFSPSMVNDLIFDTGSRDSDWCLGYLFETHDGKTWKTRLKRGGTPDSIDSIDSINLFCCSHCSCSHLINKISRSHDSHVCLNTIGRRALIYWEIEWEWQPWQVMHLALGHLEEPESWGAAQHSSTAFNLYFAICHCPALSSSVAQCAFRNVSWNVYVRNVSWNSNGVTKSKVPPCQSMSLHSLHPVTYVQ